MTTLTMKGIYRILQALFGDAAAGRMGREKRLWPTLRDFTCIIFTSLYYRTPVPRFKLAPAPGTPRLFLYLLPGNRSPLAPVPAWPWRSCHGEAGGREGIVSRSITRLYCKWAVERRPTPRWLYSGLHGMPFYDARFPLRRDQGKPPAAERPSATTFRAT